MRCLSRNGRATTYPILSIVKELPCRVCPRTLIIPLHHKEGVKNMSIYWGVVSSHAANSTVAAVGNPTLFDFITKQVQFPQFYGRFIGGHYSLTADEINFIFGQ